MFLPINPTLFGKGLAFGAMPVTAGVVGNLDVSATSASINVAAKCGGSAFNNRRYGTEINFQEEEKVINSGDGKTN